MGLRVGQQQELTIRRLKRGNGYGFVDHGGRPIRDAATLARLKSLAVPPAYSDVRYAQKPNAHLQAVGRDAAGRLQYRYHPDWEKVRELRKARRLMRLVEALPKIRRSVGQRLAAEQPTREFALSAVIELVARTAIRPGNEFVRQAARLARRDDAVEIATPRSKTIASSCRFAPRAASRCRRNATRRIWFAPSSCCARCRAAGCFSTETRQARCVR